MNFNASFLNRLFKQVDSVVWDMMSGKVGFQAGDGICSIDLGSLSEDNTEAPDAQVTINPFDEFGMVVPAFAQSVPVESISLGDMIYSSSNNRVLGWVVKKNAKSFKLMKQDGTRSDWTPPKVQMLGFDSGVMVLRSLMNMLPGGSFQLGQMQNMLMPLMMMGSMGDEDQGMGLDLSKIMPMLLFSQVGSPNAGNDMSAGFGSSMVQMMVQMHLMKTLTNNGSLGSGLKKLSNKNPNANKGISSFFDD